MAKNKIATVGTIKSYTKKKKGIEPKFSPLNFTGGQLEKLSDWIDNDDELTITIEQKQGNLPYDEKEE